MINQRERPVNAPDHIQLAKPEDLDMYMKGLPREIRNHLLYDAYFNWSARLVYGVYRKMKTDYTIQWLKSIDRNETLISYGPDHPNW